MQMLETQLYNVGQIALITIPAAITVTAVLIYWAKRAETQRVKQREQAQQEREKTLSAPNIERFPKEACSWPGENPPPENPQIIEFPFHKCRGRGETREAFEARKAQGLSNEDCSPCA